MEQVIDYVFGVLNAFADKYEWLAFALMILGGLYVVLSAIRAFLSKIVRITTKNTNCPKRPKNRKINNLGGGTNDSALFIWGVCGSRPADFVGRFPQGGKCGENCRRICASKKGNFAE